MIFAAVSTVFSVVGPKVLGKATTELATGLQNKIAERAALILQESDKSCSLCWHCMRSVPFQLFPGMDHDWDHTEGMLPDAKRDFGKDQPDADEIF